jgi:VWFA-related protein
MTIQFLRRFVFSRAAALLLGVLAAGPALATIDLRVEARPIADPIQAFVSVTDNLGNPIVGLNSSSFTVTLDTNLLTLAPTDVTLPPNQDPNQRVSVVFVMDYSQSVTDVALDAMQSAVIDFVNNMNLGDYAAIIKFNDTNPARASVVQGFTQIDQAQGNIDLMNAVLTDYPGDGTNLLDAINLAVDQFVTPPITLPPGPKAIVVISDGGENESSVEESEVIAYANTNSIAVFSIGVGDLTLPGREDLLTDLAIDTGGEYFPTANDAEIAEAYTSILTLLGNEYLITISSAINDCAVHTLQVAIPNQTTVSVQFTRRICDTEPNPFTFTNETGVAVNAQVTSNTITITGIESPAEISTQIGAYSIGCDGSFTRDPGTINNGETVCVRHKASTATSTSNTTTLTIGGVSGTFTTTTRADTGGGGGGGGGATGGLELLAGLAALFARRRRRA